MNLADYFKDAPICAVEQPCPKDPPPPVSKVLSAYFAIKKESDPPKGKKSPVEVTLQKITKAVVEAKVYIVVNTSDLKGATISVEILGSSDKKVIVAKDEALPVLQTSAERTIVTATVGNWANKAEYSNASTFADKAVIEIELKPNTKEKIKNWRSTIGKAEPKKEFLHLKVTALGGNLTEYSCEDDVLTSPDKEKSVFLNKKDLWFELHACYCDSNFTIDLLHAIGISTSKATEFLDAINSTFKDYNLDSCLKKIHFLAQAMHESGGFRLTKEGGVSENEYGGYIGRGLIQITGKANYEAYGTYENQDFTSSAEKKKQLEQLPYSARSAGWFWDVKARLNAYAAQNDFIHLTRLINGGFNGYNDRLSYLNKGFTNVYNNCINDTGKNTSYTLGASASNNEARASFAWGLWHDPNLSKAGCTKDRSLAMAGYQRFIELVAENYSEVDWYKINEISALINLKYNVGSREHIKVRAAALQLLKALRDAK